jgi:hypothetical protein
MRQLLIRTVSLGCAAAIGYCLRPPLYVSNIRLFDALFSCLLAIMIWGVFHLLGLHRLSGRRALATGAISALVWALLLTGLMGALRRIDDSRRQHQYLEELRTDSAPRRTNERIEPMTSSAIRTVPSRGAVAALLVMAHPCCSAAIAQSQPCRSQR